MEWKWKAEKIKRFIESVKDLPELITEFDESLWARLVDSMTVHSKDRIQQLREDFILQPLTGELSFTIIRER